MQAAGGGADEVGEAALDVHVDVFERARERQRARLDFALDLMKTARDGVGVGGVDDAGFSQHGDMGERAGDVLGS